MRKHKKHLDFELNLVPFIDLLSVCICFLLITAVWMNVGSMNVKQAVGGQSQDETQKKPMMWVYMQDQGALKIEIKDAPKVPTATRNLSLAGVEGQLSFESLNKLVTELKNIEPELTTALIQPQAQTSYENIIELMDMFKKTGLRDLGIVPL